ncbi:phosphopentomutase [bacterium]|nr:phosphopentomutase [bacterium]
MEYRRVYLIILDGLGVGAAPDSARFGDAGTDTLAHLLLAAPVELPELASLGLGNLYAGGLPGLPRVAQPRAHYARLTELSAGKDTTTGHWELMGLTRAAAAPVFPDGFPAEFLAEFSRRVGRGVLGNRPASGTVIIQELGAAQLASGDLIVYTSADSVFQVAAHTDVVGLAELYRICEIARGMLAGPLAVDRVIARPFTGDAATGFTRTADRRDYALPPPAPTVLDRLAQAGLDVLGVGKIHDIFAGRGITVSWPVHGNINLMRQVSLLAGREPGLDPYGRLAWRGLVFANLVDFDMLYGHRNDPAGFAVALREFDDWLAGFVAGLTDDELLLVTADHGNDPTTPGTDHTREQVPLLVIDAAIRDNGGRRLDPPAGFSHVGATILAALGQEHAQVGSNLLAAAGEK